MRAKQFFYVCAGILLLLVAYQLDAQTARADWDETLTGPIVGGAGWVFYTANGQAWTVGANGGNRPWTRDPIYDLPVPASEVKFLTWEYAYSVFVLITKSGDAWALRSLPGDTYAWFHLGPFPGQPIPVEGTTWDAFKQQFQGKK